MLPGSNFCIDEMECTKKGHPVFYLTVVLTHIELSFFCADLCRIYHPAQALNIHFLHETYPGSTFFLFTFFKTK